MTENQDTLTGVDHCPTCDSVVTFERHIDEPTGRIVHDACTTALVAHATPAAQARAMTAVAPAHVHEVRDAHDLPGTITGIPPQVRVAMELPIHCLRCDADQDTLIAHFRAHDHQVTIDNGWMILDAAPS